MGRYAVFLGKDPHAPKPRSPISGNDELRPTATYYCCEDCDVCVNRIAHCTHLFKGSNTREVVVYYERSAQRTVLKVDFSLSLKPGDANFGASHSETANIGDLMIKMIQKKGDDTKCVKCFQQSNETMFRSVALSVKGKAWLINPDFTLNEASVGDVSGW